MKNYLSKFSLTILFFSVLLTSCIGQKKALVIYESYEEYVKNKGQVYEGDYILRSAGSRPGVGNRVMTFKNKSKEASSENKQVKIKLKEVWGFSLNDLLMRVDKSMSFPYYLVAKDSICYYENGYAVLKMLKANGNVEEELYKYYDSSGDWGRLQFVSKSLDSKMFSFSSKGKAGKFVKTYPEYQSLYDCIFPVKRKQTIEKTRNCVKEFNKE